MREVAAWRLLLLSPRLGGEYHTARCTRGWAYSYVEQACLNCPNSLLPTRFERVRKGRSCCQATRGWGYKSAGTRCSTCRYPVELQRLTALTPFVRGICLGYPALGVLDTGADDATLVQTALYLDVCGARCEPWCSHRRAGQSIPLEDFTGDRHCRGARTLQTYHLSDLAVSGLGGVTSSEMAQLLRMVERQTRTLDEKSLNTILHEKEQIMSRSVCWRWSESMWP